MIILLLFRLVIDGNINIINLIKRIHNREQHDIRDYWLKISERELKRESIENISEKISMLRIIYNDSVEKYISLSFLENKDVQTLKTLKNISEELRNTLRNDAFIKKQFNLHRSFK